VAAEGRRGVSLGELHNVAVRGRIPPREIVVSPTLALAVGLASESQTRSDDGELAALRRVTFQRLLEHAEDAEVWIRPFGDQAESTFSAAGTDRSAVLERQLGRYGMQIYKNTHCRFLQSSPPRQGPSRKIKSTLWRAAGRCLTNETRAPVRFVTAMLASATAIQAVVSLPAQRAFAAPLRGAKSP
jgi:hypothetical protein